MRKKSAAARHSFCGMGVLGFTTGFRVGVRIWRINFWFFCAHIRLCYKHNIILDIDCCFLSFRIHDIYPAAVSRVSLVKFIFITV